MENVSEPSRLLSAADIRLLADKAGIRPTKTLGQNFVIDPNTIRRIVAAAEVTADEHVLEVGPGLGSLTLGLLDAAEKVTAVEIDAALAGQLAETIAEYRPERAGQLHLIHSDAMEVSAEQIAQTSGSLPSALVANLPYNVAVPVLLHLLAELPELQHALVMVQEEVADRLAADPGSKVYGVPSVKASWYGHVRKAGVIGMRVFWPEPKITSGLVHFRCYDEHEAARVQQGADRELTFALIDAAFAQRRKTLRAALGPALGSPAQAEDVLRSAGIDHTLRGERLTISDFATIALAAAETEVR
ncbi:16S rRNA (adenine(1518)-N(6)/adenine(1519)-N(6))-dimethyltransferase RsmA [Micrococcoides hystricis]|uniref:Ribosomal RNA small subunit methyltransferase A n=1 Tax=Micrococcoides hystricis TaxID=1572761 RepID=A0ABV6PCF2_9MICC